MIPGPSRSPDSDKIFQVNFNRERHIQNRKMGSPTLANESFHATVRHVLIIGQSFAMIPVTGITQDISKVKFKWLSFQTFLAIFFITCVSIELVLAVLRTIRLNISISTAGVAIYFLNTITVGILLFILATKWESFIKFWRLKENCFLREPYVIHGMKLKTKITLITVLVLGFTIVEHILYLSSTLYYGYKQIHVCNITKVSVLKFVMMKEKSHIFSVIPFTYYLVPLIEWVNMYRTVAWNYVDLIIMIISIGLTTRFNQINNRLLANYRRNVTESYWTEIRTHYAQLIELLHAVDNDFSWIILLSCSSNLYFICYQLFNSFTPIPFLISNMFFWFSLLFLIGRTLCVLFFAASIHDASKRPLIILRDIPTKFWNMEVQRFLNIVADECVALSGRRFFFLTRKLILAMAGTIVTYELVLLDEVEQDVEKKSLCNITRLVHLEVQS